MPLTIRLQLLQLVLPNNPTIFRYLLQGFKNAGHHPLQTTKEHMRAIIQPTKDFVRILTNDILYIILTTRRIFHLTTNGVVHLELPLSITFHNIYFFWIQQARRDGHTEDQPRSRIEHMPGHGLLHKQPVQETTEWCNASPSRDHNHIRVTVVRQTHGLAHGTSDLDLIASLGIAQKVGTHALFRFIFEICHGIVVFSTAYAQGYGIPIEQIPVSRACNAIQARFVLFASF
mmetsp:Transcript_25567/g.38172  ORF Transcript_25567/g.38172 Transcript_25567/m.38172 type:complete len:231 (-) Transcript_25567:699-1391(-)